MVTTVCMEHHHWSLSGDPISIPALVARCGDQCLHGTSLVPGLGWVVSGVAALLWCCGAVVVLLLSPATAPRQSGDVFSDIHCTGSSRPQPRLGAGSLSTSQGLPVLQLGGGGAAQYNQQQYHHSTITVLYLLRVYEEFCLNAVHADHGRVHKRPLSTAHRSRLVCCMLDTAPPVPPPESCLRLSTVSALSTPQDPDLMAA